MTLMELWNMRHSTELIYGEIGQLAHTLFGLIVLVVSLFGLVALCIIIVHVRDKQIGKLERELEAIKASDSFSMNGERSESVNMDERNEVERVKTKANVMSLSFPP